MKPKYDDKARAFVRGLIKSNIPEAIRRHVLAQWILESGHFRSRLCIDANNAGGMKYREGYPGEHGTIRYTDWEQMQVLYFRLNRPEDYADLYWWFVNRPRYAKAIVEAQSGNGDGYIYQIALAGYVASMPGVAKENIPQEYLSKIIDIMNRPATEELYRSEWTDGVASMMGTKNDIQHEDEEVPDWMKLYVEGEE